LIIACPPAARKGSPARRGLVSLLLALGALWGVSPRVAGEPTQPALPALTVTHPGGLIVIHDLAPALRLGPRLAPAAAAAARELPIRLGVSLPSMVVVVIAGDAETFAAASGRDPSRLLGVARPGAQRVVLNAARLGPGPEAGAVGVLRHELAHLALAEAEDRAGPLPRWFDEGAASWFAGGTAEQGPVDLAQAAGSPELDLSHLTPSFPEDPAQIGRAYAKSQLAVEVLVDRIRERGGTADLRAVGEALTAGTAFESALATATGLDLAGLEQALRSRLLGRELLAALLRQAEWGLGLAMALLAGLGYVRYRRRLRRRLERWGREEAGRDSAGAEDREARDPGEQDPRG
jgi:hypothetical protein